MARQLHAAGHDVVETLAEADIHIVNSCTVTHAAARDSRKVARRGHRFDTNLTTVLTGCYVEESPEEAARLAGVDLVVPNGDKASLIERLHRHLDLPLPASTDWTSLPIPFVPLEFGNSRALVKIEDGCNMRCSFCIIPSTRGPQTSRPAAAVLREVEALAEAGFAEIVVTGVQISAYRHRSQGLIELLEKMLLTAPGPRFRVTSIAPWQFDNRLLSLMAGGRICRHIHVSLQSGCSRTLRRMRRPYTAEDFALLVEMIRAAVPGVALTTDVIVGFPGESEADFAASLNFVESMQFARVHAFPYSPRAGTEAAAMPGQVSADTKRQRMQLLLEVARESRLRFEKAHEGLRGDVLWERKRQDTWSGLTDNYLRVRTTDDGPVAGQIASVRLDTSTDRGLWSGSPEATEKEINH